MSIICYRIINGNIFGRAANTIENAFFSTNIESVFNILKANDNYDIDSSRKLSKQKFLIAEIYEWRNPLNSEKFGFVPSTDTGEIICLKGNLLKTLEPDEAYDFLIKQLSNEFINSNSDFLFKRNLVKNKKRFLIGLMSISWTQKVECRSKTEIKALFIK